MLPPTTTGLSGEPTGAVGSMGALGSAGCIPLAAGGTAPVGTSAFGSAAGGITAGGGPAGWLTGGTGAGGLGGASADGGRGGGDDICATAGAETPAISSEVATIDTGIGISDEQIVTGFERFDGVKRRFTHVGEADGAIVIDDYAHHPTEIRAVLAAAREGAQGRVIAVVQPHRYTRLRDLMEDFQSAFNDADVVFVAPVYPAGEEPIEGVDSNTLAEGLRAHGHRMVSAVKDQKELSRSLRDLAAEGDMIICMGAGDITKWAATLPDDIRKARAKK